MGKVLSIVRNSVKNFNVENRAHRVISREKPLPAPRHEADQIAYQKLRKDTPEIYEELLRKNEKLDDFLKNVYVSSSDPVNQSTSDVKQSNKPLPLDRKTVEDFDLGVKESEKVPLGKVTLRSALQFITDHQVNPLGNTSTKIAEKYVLPEETVKNILKYFKVYEMYVPQERDSKVNFAGPAVTRKLVFTEPRKALSHGETLERDEKK